ncbi:MAG: rhodanese-like domain-containing protein [Pseudomonadota bacterium]
MGKRLSAKAVKSLLSETGEIGFFDVREYGQYGAAHPFFVIPLAYSVFELRLPALAPRQSAPLVLMDDGDGIADRAAARAEALGYGDVSVLDGGAPAWAAAGYTLYEGVNVPSKTFGELLELARHTPRLSAREVAALKTDGTDHVIVDGRPFGEYQKMNIPGGVCCPNGELALRIGEIAPDPQTTIVVNCAGRTRSILGAQTLIDFGIPNPVFALENGTQGWFLADLELENGADRRMDRLSPGDLDARQAAARALATRNGVPLVLPQEVEAWVQDPGTTTYLLDVRSAEEFAADGKPGTTHAPGGQLVQATDQWVGVRNAQIVLLDSDGVRAPVTANWLRQMGHNAVVLEGGVAAAGSLHLPDRQAEPKLLPTVPEMSVESLKQAMSAGAPHILDLRSGMTHRAGHVAGARWCLRPQISNVAAEPDHPVVLLSDDAGKAALFAQDLAERGVTDISRLAGNIEAWRAGGLSLATSETPSDAACIDYLFFTHDRHAGNRAAAERYIEWELGLVDQLDTQERAVFRMPS